MNLASRRFHPSSRRDAGNALIVAVMFMALFATIIGAAFYLSEETNRRSTRMSRFSAAEVAGDGVMDVMYGRFTNWVNAHSGLTPGITPTVDAATVGTPANPAFPAITGAITTANCSGLSNYTVTNITLVPLMPDGSTGTDFPSWSTYAASHSTYQGLVNKYYINIPNIYALTNMTQTLRYQASATLVPSVVDSLHPGSVLVKRVFESSQVSPFTYNTFTMGTYESYNWGQSYDEESNVYAALNIKLDAPGTIVDGNMRYGGAFYDPTGTAGGSNELVFENPTSKAVDTAPYSDGLLTQVSPIEIVPNLTNVIAHNADGTRSASAETTIATMDSFSQREIIEPPNVPGNDTAPDQIASRRIYNQADGRIKISVLPNPYAGMAGQQKSYATATFYNLDGTVLASYVGALSANGSSGSTTWYPTAGGTTVTNGLVSAINVNPVNSGIPFYDPSRTQDAPALDNSTVIPGQPTTANAGAAIEIVDVNVSAWTTVMNANASSFPASSLYIWDDGTSGQKNGIRLYDGGTLPSNGLVVASTDPIYIKGDYNTGTVLANNTDINAASTATQPAANSMGYNNGASETAAQRAVNGYTPVPAGVFGDTVTTLSQSWQDAKSGSATQYAQSTTYNVVMGFGSGDFNSLQPNDTFTNNQYASVQSLEYWNNCRWSQGGSQMALYHSVYNRHKAPPSWISGGWFVGENDYNSSVSRLPLRWGTLVFSRGGYTRTAPSAAAAKIGVGNPIGIGINPIGGAGN